MIDLTQTTFIIPVKIDHGDRYRNAKTVLGFLNHHFNTNVFIFESSPDGTSKLDFLDDLRNLKIKKWNVQDEGVFHRTKYLNIMLDEVDTEVVVNYDIDVILDPSNYLECQNLIFSGEFDVIYPYELSGYDSPVESKGQIQVLPNFDYDLFSKEFSTALIKNRPHQISYNAAECGHCIFFKTDVYKKFGGENEEFVSYGPEDKERMLRFQKFSSKVGWRKGERVFHFEHFRGNDSWTTNPFFSQNWRIFSTINGMNVPDLFNYYSSRPYLVNYKTLGIVIYSDRNNFLESGNNPETIHKPTIIIPKDPGSDKQPTTSFNTTGIPR